MRYLTVNFFLNTGKVTSNKVQEYRLSPIWTKYLDTFKQVSSTIQCNNNMTQKKQ